MDTRDNASRTLLSHLNSLRDAGVRYVALGGASAYASHDILNGQGEFSGSIAKNKGNASRPCPEELLDELAERCDIVVTSPGD